MRQILILPILLFSITVFSQETNFLQSENGFREIKLGSNIKDYKFFEKKNENNEEYFGMKGRLYEYIYIGNEYTKIGNTDIFRIFVNVYNDLIYKIEIITAKDYNLWKSIENAYGKPTVSVEGMKGWYPGKIRCRITGESDLYKNYFIEYEDVELESLAIKKKIKEEKENAQNQFKN